MEKESSSKAVDEYQKRYIEHQIRKKESLMNLMRARHSDRIFSDKEISSKELSLIIEMANLAPSSCNRKAVSIKVVQCRDDKALLGGLLVGGVGWIHKAESIFLFVANKNAYKEKLQFMPYLDCGFVAEQIYLICTAMDIKCCFVNPNIREDNYKYFADRFLLEDEMFLGTMAIGK